MDKNPTVSDLRKSKNKVRVTHLRVYKIFNPKARTVRTLLLTRRQAKETLSPEDYRLGLSAKGGKTIVDITTHDGKNFTGVAKCDASDSFNRRLSLNKALGRAVRQLV